MACIRAKVSSRCNIFFAAFIARNLRVAKRSHVGTRLSNEKKRRSLVADGALAVADVVPFVGYDARDTRFKLEL